MKTNMFTIGNVPMQLVDKSKGDMSNRLEAAGATLKNNFKYSAKTAGVLGASLLAADTFAGNKVILNQGKSFISKLPASIQQFATNFATKHPKLTTQGKAIIDKVANNATVQKGVTGLKNTSGKVGTKLAEWGSKLCGSAFMQKAKGKAVEWGSKLVNSNFVKNIKNNKKLAIFAVAATALAGVFTSWGHSQGKIDQLYEDKAAIEANTQVLD